MTTLLLTVLIITAGAAFAWYRIKTRGVAIVLDETRRFIALQNTKDVMAFKVIKRYLLILWVQLSGLLAKLSRQAQQLHSQYQQKEKERVAKWQQDEKVRAAQWQREKERATYRTQQARVRQARQESVRSTGTASSGSWLNSPWVWLLGAYWLGQHSQKLQQQQRRNEPDFSKYPYTMDGRTWNPYKKRHERR